MGCKERRFRFGQGQEIEQRTNPEPTCSDPNKKLLKIPFSQKV